VASGYSDTRTEDLRAALDQFHYESVRAKCLSFLERRSVIANGEGILKLLRPVHDIAASKGGAL